MGPVDTFAYSFSRSDREVGWFVRHLLKADSDYLGMDSRRHLQTGKHPV